MNVLNPLHACKTERMSTRNIIAIQNSDMVLTWNALWTITKIEYKQCHSHSLCIEIYHDYVVDTGNNNIMHKLLTLSQNIPAQGQ